MVQDYKHWKLDRDWGWDILDGDGKEVFHCVRRGDLAEKVVDAVNAMLDAENPDLHHKPSV